MKQRIVTIYQCEHCYQPRPYMTKGNAMKHETRCPKNPGRTPRTGELYALFESKEFNFQIKHRQRWFVSDSTAMNEPREDGMIWSGEEWLPIPGFGRRLDGIWMNNPWQISALTDDGEYVDIERISLCKRIPMLAKVYGESWAADERKRRDLLALTATKELTYQE
jgi:hypothetical protein